MGKNINTDINPDTNIGTKGVWKGIIKSVLYLGQNNFAVISVDLDNGENIIAQGNICYAQKGNNITLKGEIENNVKYNRKQIKVESSDAVVDINAKSAISFLTNAVHGLGEKTARKIVEKYGTDLDDFMTDEKKLTTISGISLNGFLKIKASYLDNKELFPIYKAVCGEITYNQAVKIHENYGDNAAVILKNNPYQLTYDLDGIGFLKADKLALKAGIKADSDNRILAAINYCLKSNEQKSGSSYLPLNNIYEDVTELIFNKSQYMNIYYQNVLGVASIPDDISEWQELKLEDIIKNHNTKLNNTLKKWDMDSVRNKFIKEFDLSQEEIDTLDSFYEKKMNLNSQLDKLIKQNSYDVDNKPLICVIQEMNENPYLNKKYQFVADNIMSNQKILYIFNTYKAECEVAYKIIKIHNQNSIFNIENSYIDNIIAQAEKDELKILKIEDAKKPVMQRKCPTKYSFGEDQKDAIRMALNNRFSCITGGPGRGKTTIEKTIIKAWVSMDKEANVILLAPTGKAAKRMSEATGYPAYTIHRFIRNKNITLNSKTIIFIDESSMMDLFLFNSLLNKIQNCQIVIIGDKDQLPSVGVGKCLEDIISSGIIPVTFLTTCYRNKGSILNNVDAVNASCRLQELQVDEHFKTIWLNDKDKIIEAILNTYMNNYERYGANNMLVLAAMSDTVSKLNSKIQQRVNPKTPNKRDIQIGEQVFRIGDRVMQISNDYNIVTIDSNGEEQKGVFNGEIGTISNIFDVIDPDTKILQTKIEVTFDDGKVAKYENRASWSKLTLAYAMTYHKSQGSETKFLICTLTTADFILLQKKILYTGISRAKEMDYLIGSAKAFQMAIYNYSGKNGIRYSGLKEKIQDLANY